MLQIHCTGTPFEIGYTHGSQARDQVHRSIKFYAGLFERTAKLSWQGVRETAQKFENVIAKQWPRYLEEMRGLAAGSQTHLLDIIALNVRTEISFGLFSDGCTAMAWKKESACFLAQNWDWEPQQKENLIILTISPSSPSPSPTTTIKPPPTIKIVTEAGLLGKIGLNSSGVGVCLNAIRAKGLDTSRIPCHLGLRMVLECETKDEAVEKLMRAGEGGGVASACHMLIADAETGGLGLEWSFTDLQKLPPNSSGQVFHTNHYLVPHPNVISSLWLEDSIFRLKRIQDLCNQLIDPKDNDNNNDNNDNKDAQSQLCLRAVQSIFTDEENFPCSICRAEEQGKGSATLFNIVMDLENRAAKVVLGRPTAPEGFFELSF